MITSNFEHKTFTFPVGEMQVNLDLRSHYPRNDRDVFVTFTFKSNADIIELLLFCDAAKRAGLTLITLTMPYVPFSRQDRVNAGGESFSLAVFAGLINSLEFKHVVITDPHSDVTPALIHNVKVVAQAEGFMKAMPTRLTREYWLVSPDAGANKKTYHLAKSIKALVDSSMMCRNLLGVIESSKTRNTSTGEISGTVVHCDYCSSIHDYIMVDDICDGGRTFIELAKELRSKGARNIMLFVTHGFFTKGMDVFCGVIDSIFTPDGLVFNGKEFIKEKAKLDKVHQTIV